MSFDPARIPEAIKKAGFSVPAVVVTAEGVLEEKPERLELRVPGLPHLFVLAGGAQEPALQKRADLRGKKVQVSGKLRTEEGELPPGLSVEQFQPAAD